ncbi:LysR family transcriptional regulator [Sphingomonas naphthae]|uniref:LysR family transcriptional regulator n=1 Tax=Sphingomonas naphthae TaxID=1813468 RepID=A0ABY7TI53_9SPHN|nr:LysR family transcriptional regulator [Sphingomonas naphthae]WCT72845.1 LysR family transcriptional regulator [Sphingomonas naphthae]
MDWDDLRIFATVARARQIGRAAAQLGIDPTTAGRRLRRLEKAVGQTLLEQRRDGQRLTEAGEALFARAEAVARMLDGVDEGDGETGRGLLRVSASEGFGGWFVAPRLGDFTAANPGVRVDLVATSGFLSPSRRETDVAIMLARPRRGPVVTRKLIDYGLGLYAARAYFADAPPADTVTDLRRHPLIGYIPDLMYAPELDYLDEVEPGLEPALRSSSIIAQYRLAEAGAGIAVLPCFIADGDPALMRVLPQVAIRRAFWLVVHQDTRAVPRVRRFVEWLTALAEAERGRLAGR